jgi:hypothetical protein
MVLEKEIERHLVGKCKTAGALCLKFTSPGLAGVPDRIVIHEGRVYFVELKSPTGKQSLLQRGVERLLQSHGASCHVLGSKAAVDRFVRAEVQR